jgi:hypothetical protein
VLEPIEHAAFRDAIEARVVAKLFAGAAS